MNSKQLKALQSFRAGLNCAQAVLTAYSEEMDFDKSLALRISCGFGGGMGRLQETCGAVTGAFMVLGIYYCSRFKDDKDRKEATYAAIRKFDEKFKTIYGTSDCKLLLNADLNTGEGRQYIKEHRLHDTICEKCIADAVAIANELISD
jgi:C_GCAxxG_C_C family probable redox protein